MGYTTYMILMYGVTLNNEQMLKLKALVEERELCDYDEGVWRITPEDDLTIIDSVPKGTPLEELYRDGLRVPFNHYRSGMNMPRKMHFAACMTHGADSRCDSCMFDEHLDAHTFGIVCAEHGYPDGDKIEKIILNMPQKAKDNFEKHCAPLLAEIGVESAPEPVLLNQVW